MADKSVRELGRKPIQVSEQTHVELKRLVCIISGITGTPVNMAQVVGMMSAEWLRIFLVVKSDYGQKIYDIIDKMCGECQPEGED